ncbi:hypothetical protein [Heyndrickxia camelliae]|uniref:Uncharacterized protein n=1 Tax=Heyndrickxia camelliae TaxID=1707093 RepID=A0A2N3LE74_9BACI|nr:hypothetical protein [Heyndrickxia camelliae]PKR82847.1 hypothetical protein CWO92_21900 [Heyndrickxia camelliae]
MSKTTQLKVSKIKKAAKEVNKQIEHEFEDGSTLKFYPIFPELKIDELIEDNQKLIREADELGIELSEKMTYHLISLLIIKHFTHLGADIEDGVQNHIAFLEALIDSGYYKIIMEEVFLPAEISKVFDRMVDLVSQYQMMEKLVEKTKEQVQRLELKNAEVFKQLENVGVEKQIPEV